MEKKTISERVLILETEIPFKLEVMNGIIERLAIKIDNYHNDVRNGLISEIVKGITDNLKDRDSGIKTRRGDNLSIWKKLAVISAFLTAFVSIAYSAGSFFIWLGNFLQSFPK
jgi:hypothetical protein